VREKIFPKLSEDVWLLCAEGFGESSESLSFQRRDCFGETASLSGSGQRVSVADLERWRFRLRPFLLNREPRELYERLVAGNGVRRLASMARVGIGYVSGANDFFHLRPSQAKALRIPSRFLQATVRNSGWLSRSPLDDAQVEHWLIRDDPIFLLRIRPNDDLPRSVQRYLDSDSGRKAREAYKCRTRSPWYAVPDVKTPDAFLTYMTSAGPALVKNSAKCACTNSVHAVTLTNGSTVGVIARDWQHPLTVLSSELEGHPLGGGMLKLEPREAGRLAIVVKRLNLEKEELSVLKEGSIQLRRWRHHECR